MKNRAALAFISPAGSTRHVARVIEAAAAERGVPPVVLDLKEAGETEPFLEAVRSFGPGDLLFVGSPVYRDMAVPPVMRFIESLPASQGAAAVPFVTWGGAFSGVALWQMAQALTERGFVIAGGAKVLGRHSMMYRSDPPLGDGRPDAGDDQMVAGLVEALLGRAADGSLRPLEPAALDDHPAEHSASARERLEQPWMVIPKTVDESACTECGTCKDECPVGAIALDPFPRISDACFDCFNCVRLCPEEAVQPQVAYADIEKMIRNRARAFNETPPTRVYLHEVPR